MIIKKIKLQNFQVIKDFEADFDGNVYLIKGDNELGKSTLLKAIGALLTGQRDSVLRNGEDKGFARMVLDEDGKEYEVKLSYTKANPRGTLTITTEGVKSNNISTLNKLFGYTDFDAVEFSRWSETAEGRRRQVEVVKSLLPEEVLERIEKLDERIKDAIEQRKVVNAKEDAMATIYDAAFEKVKGIDEKKYQSRISTKELIEEQAQRAQRREQAKMVLTQRETRINQLSQIATRVSDENVRYEATIENARQAKERAKEEYERRLAEIDAELESNNQYHVETLSSIEMDRVDYQRRKDNADKWLADFEKLEKEYIDIDTRIAEAEKHNSIVTLFEDYNKKREEYEKILTAKKEHEDAVVALRNERKDVVAHTQLPIEGLTFTEDGIELNNIPFVAGKVSDSQIMETAVKLVMASNSKVKVFRIARGESLGAKRLKEIVDIAKQNGFQGFIEQVERGQMEMLVEEYEE